MMTDEAIRDSLHAHLDADLHELLPPAGLLQTLRRRQARRSTMVVSAVAVATVSTAVAAPLTVRALPGGPSSSNPSSVAGPGIAAVTPVTLDGLRFELPADLQIYQGPETQSVAASGHSVVTTGSISYVVANDGNLAPVEHPTPYCMDADVGLPGSRRERKTGMSCGRSIQVSVLRGPIAGPEHFQWPHNGDRIVPSPTEIARRSVDIGQGSAWIGTFGEGRFLQLRVQLTAERSITVMAQDLTEDEVLNIVRAALQG